ncbi:caspase family protein [Methylobacterium oryzisoli]|uniref:caspase family protein n=1 Tax=Methylobacterium oryzisoli TaxID=3385502 RepID=UPI003891F62D
MIRQRYESAFVERGRNRTLPRSASIADASAEISRAASLSPEDRQLLRPHVVSLIQGRLSTDGILTTNQNDIDKLFSTHLEIALAEAKAVPRPLRIVFFAHGGLVAESTGLAIARKHLNWWKANDVYPINFVWETGLLHSVAAVLRDAAGQIGLGRIGRGTRDLWDYTTDPLLEMAGRAIGADKIWSSMKRSAERSSDDEGGVTEVLKQLNTFLTKHAGDAIELHAVGHSAGSIFHSHLLRRAATYQQLVFNTVSLLAPAVTTQEFKRTIVPEIGNSVKDLTLFTMRDELERADSCVEIYRKSLLYFVKNACEERKSEPILGLESDLRADDDLVEQFGLGAPAVAGASNVVWSKTNIAEGRDASQSVTHGGFDDDPATMNAVLRRMLAKRDDEGIKFSYLADSGARFAAAHEVIDWPEPVMHLAARSTLGWIPDSEELSEPKQEIFKPEHGSILRKGQLKGARRVAVCVGINQYSGNPLSYCADDAKAWSQSLEECGFETVALLLDEQASRETIIDVLQRTLRECRNGDSFVFQFAGHGALSPFWRQNPEYSDDNAIVPVDGEGGELIFDYELRRIFDECPQGVIATCFMDCCHSETNTRKVLQEIVAPGWVTPPSRIYASLGLGRNQDSTENLNKDMLLNFLSSDVAAATKWAVRSADITQEMEHAFYEVNRGRRSRSSSRVRSSAREMMRNVSFAACQDKQLAYEWGGSGRFTHHATAALRQSKNANWSNRQFIDEVIRAFGPSAPQTPRIDATTANFDAKFLA